MTPRYPCFLLLGDTPAALPWSAALPAILPCATTTTLAACETDGILIVGALDTEALEDAKDALRAGVPVLCLAPARLPHQQVLDLCVAAEEGEALLRFAPSFENDDETRVLRRLGGGAEPLLSIHYVMLSRQVNRADRCLSERLNEELAALSMLGEVERVYALGDSSDLASASVVFVTLEFRSGLAGLCTVNLSEGAETRRVTIGTEERTLVLRGERQARPGPPATSVSDAELPSFCRAALAGDLALANYREWPPVAALWAAVRESLASRLPAAVGSVSYAQKAKPPSLRLIEGGGMSSGRGRRPHLTLVAT